MKFRLNQAGVARVVADPKVSAYLRGLGGVVKSQVERTSAPFARTRHFARSIRVHAPERTARGQSVTVDSSDFAAHIIEFGSANNPPYAPFRKAASALGLTLRGGGERR